MHLERGSRLRLTHGGSGECENGVHVVPTVTCTLPEVFEQVGIGERIWFDDGRIGGVIRRIERDWLEVEITHARDSGEKLAGDKGINLPDSKLDLPALTDKDCEDLAIVAKLADLVGLSFVQRAGDVETLRVHLRDLGMPDLGIMLKIETRRSFENLPELLFSAMANKASGVMIARGDLAVECGYERLAEIQEEILWAAEAAHMPVIWATQVLETLAKTGVAHPCRDYRCGHGRTGGVRHAQQRTPHQGSHAHPRRYLAPHASPPGKETPPVTGTSCLDVNAQAGEAGA